MTRNERQRRYYEANREKVAAKQRAYYQANRERIRASWRAYYQANRERLLARDRERRAARRAELGPRKPPGRKCKACVHPARPTIDTAILAGESLYSIAKAHDLSRPGVRRHRDNHLIERQP